MIESNTESPKRAPSGFLIDDELIAAAIWEMRMSPLPTQDDISIGECEVGGRQTFFLLIMIELMLPGISGEEVLRILHRFALSPIAPQLEKS